MKYTLIFSKLGYLKFISHLDMLRLFKRAFKRGEIYLKFSEGFNPHPKITFGQPLSLGHGSICEILDIETKLDYDENHILKTLNTVLPEDIRIISCKKQDESYKSMASKISWAKYLIEFPSIKDIEKSVIEFLNMPEIKTLKRQKKKKDFKEINISSMIRGYEIPKNFAIYPTIDRSKFYLLITVDCGSISNLNPDLLIKAFISWFKKLDVADLVFEDIDVVRVGLG